MHISMKKIISKNLIQKDHHTIFCKPFFINTMFFYFIGIWGTIAVVFTNGDASLGTQLYSIIVVGIFVTVASAIVWFILKATTGIRVAEEDEINGLDMSELGMDAYPEFSKS